MLLILSLFNDLLNSDVAYFYAFFVIKKNVVKLGVSVDDRPTVDV